MDLEEHPAVRVTREVFLAIDAAVVSAAGLVETDSEPRAGGELRATDEANCPANFPFAVAVPDLHNHLVAHLIRHLCFA